MAKRVLILGATSSVATEVALLHAKRGDHLHLVGRNPDKLDAVAAACAAAGAARVTSETADFSDLDANEDVIRKAEEALAGIDVALIAHGDLGDQLASERTFSEAEKILRTNFLSAVSLLIPLANLMEAQSRGTLGVITSVAGERGRPRNYTYGAAKGALNVFLQGMRTRLYPSGVKVTTLKLGPTDSPMTRGHDKHLLFGKPAGVARDIMAAMDAGKAEAYVPAFWGAIMPIVKNTPEQLFQLLPFLSGR
jgi:short-subunit dehydrogenase